MVLFLIIARIHNYKDKSMASFESLPEACNYFNLSKRPLLRELDKLNETGLINFEYKKHSKIKIELRFERPNSNFTKLPASLIRDAKNLSLTASSFALLMFLLYKFSLPSQKNGPLSANLDYFGKVIHTTARTAKIALQSLVKHGFIECVFSKFQTRNPCIIKQLFMDNNYSLNQANYYETSQLTTGTEHIAFYTAPDKKHQNPEQVLKDLVRVLKRHGRNAEDAPLIIKFLNQASVGLDKRPIKSIPAVWEKDLQSKLKILQFRFSEWKHEEEKKENKLFFEHQSHLAIDLASNSASHSISHSDSHSVSHSHQKQELKNDQNKNQYKNRNKNQILKLKDFSSNQKAFKVTFPTKISQNSSNFSNYIRNYLNTEEINNHLRGKKTVNFTKNFSDNRNFYFDGLNSKILYKTENLANINSKTKVKVLGYIQGCIQDHIQNNIEDNTQGFVHDYEYGHNNDITPNGVQICLDIGDGDYLKTNNTNFSKPSTSPKTSTVYNYNYSNQSSVYKTSNFSLEEQKVIKLYQENKNMVRVIKTEDFIKRYLPLGLELYKLGKEITLNSILELYKNNHSIVASSGIKRNQAESKTESNEI